MIMNKPRIGKLDSAGWGVWLIAFGILLLPCIYGSFQIVDEKQPPYVPVFMGGLFAGFAAAVVTWLMNVAIQARVRRERMQERRKNRKNK